MNSVTSDLVDNHWRPDPDNQNNVTKLPQPSMDQPGGLFTPEYVQVKSEILIVCRYKGEGAGLDRKKEDILECN